ncbi:MAG: hypothetical protein A2653_01445 [Candidatus Zambryskibacteria bacterium RIFCSPHIGHO2_01_FULL_43_25]|uniref:DNA 3'-5' helicase n=1 Tax=Candidatus Zambryskibacteria bacterium RIFCSPLOWO2_01_FULL_45_21 TaxID=1802761 RepID=A0A1G2U3S9_9BACT|nr:MAG: hypothetical protein A2653_01445 [Candidatus Zambryskibacteria bacterium RIFCSPHIGHO2_01_FULL_43_25]OHB00382.1 MAG: hypothetical protein A3E94_01595 [Candidatus Zambryskibacteria bacterium RIFCSPHIGHO2_12_FULL_44_12b]OHB04177.1 MAG: hypothetical protein A3B14_02065 [Candidatus Zambryskibacteria bacterium RIFCSPLOWO2_01_FULL_45_21]
MSEISFENAYKKLNKEQREAVDTVEGPVMVIAGPGTGKTSILTLRIANILRRTDTSPGSILALTFTESGVHSMRRKLVEIIGPAAYRVGIFTFHGFCNEVMRRFPDCFERILGGHLATEVDQIKVVENIIRDGKFHHLKLFGNNFFYARPALQSIRSLKRENITPKEFSGILAEKQKEFDSFPNLYHERGQYKGRLKGRYAELQKKIEKNRELSSLYLSYEKALKKDNLYDYEDMIIEVVLALEKNNDLLLMLEEEYQYILADEHQDANNAQNKILLLLSSFHKSPNLFIVGDEKQAIYRFQGASLENFLYFKKKFKDAQVIRLPINYRSTQKILDASHTLIMKAGDSNHSLRRRLIAKNKKLGRAIKFYEFESADAEPLFLITDIEKKIESGVTPSDIAVLFRDNNDAVPIVQVMEKTDIPFLVLSSDDVLEDSLIRQYIALLKAVNNFGNDDYLSRVLFAEFLSIAPLDAYRINKYAHTRRLGVSAVLESRNELARSGVTDKIKFKKLYSDMSRWSKVAKNDGLLSSAEKIARESGFIDYLMSQKNSVSNFEKIDALFRQMRSIVETHRDYTLADFIEYISVLENHSIRMEIPYRPVFKTGVHLMTAHRSKGLEFKYVYIVGAYDGHWGNRRAVVHFHLPITGKPLIGFDEDEDERRLFYVALTRAKDEVVITSSKWSKDNKPRLPSRFVEEIDMKFLEKVSPVPEKELSKLKEGLIHKTPQGGAGVDDAEYLRNLFLDQGLSVTAVNNYLECPWKFFFQNLIRVPKNPEKHQLYGTAVHEALKYFFDKYKDGYNPTLKDLKDWFSIAVSRKPLSQNDFAEALDRGGKALAGYFKKYNKLWPRAIINELAIAGVFIPIDGGKKILLRGILDKVEFISGSEVRVVDYKTGKPRSRNDILGKTKGSKGNIGRQLDFYNVLLQDYENGKYRMKEGMIDFVEPNDQGNYRQEKFEANGQDAEELKNLIKKIASEIYSLSFWDKRCGDRNCEYCRLRGSISAAELH